MSRQALSVRCSRVFGIIVKHSQCNNMNITQSFLYTVCRVPLNLYEQRILLSVIVQNQDEVKDLYLANVLQKIEHHFDNVQCKIAIKDILPEGNKHYEHVVSAVKSLQGKIFEFYNSQSGQWFCTPIVYNASHVKGQGIIKFYVARVFFDVLLDFTKGFRKYDFFSAMRLTSPYSCRMYALMSGQVRPIQLKLGYIRKMFGLDDRYSQTADLIKRVIEPARKELDAQGLTSFTYSRVWESRKVVALTFFPVIRGSQDKNQLLAQISTAQFLTQELRSQLVVYAGFSIAELGHHKALLDDLCKIDGSACIVAEIVNRAKSRGKSKGYIINALRSEVEAYKATFGQLSEQPRTSSEEDLKDTQD